jgi:hypothetical protein
VTTETVFDRLREAHLKVWAAPNPFRSVVYAEITQDPEELPDDQIVPDNTDPLPPDPEVKTDPVDDE